MVQQPVFLYIEDDALSREIMEMLLLSLGYTKLTMFDSSENFLERIEAMPSKPDVIFLDIHMKPYNGFEMLEVLRQHPTLGSKRIIAVTASVMNEEVARLRAVGFDGAIGKPLDYEHFAILVKKVLNDERVWHIT